MFFITQQKRTAPTVVASIRVRGGQPYVTSHALNS
jgi:hypothetical protein